MKKILVIGGSYFLGRVFVETLLEKGGWDITVLNRGRIPFRDERVRQLVCDRRDEAGLTKILAPETPQTVVDFCAYSADDVKTLISALPGAAVGRYVLISTASVYDNQSPEIPLTEEAPLLGRALTEAEDYGGYVQNKLAAEKAAAEGLGGTETALTILRPAIIFGKFNYAPRESYFFERIISGDTIKIPESGGDSRAESRYSFVSVWDAAELIAWSIEAPEAAGERFNLAAPEQISYRLLAEAFSAACNLKTDIEELNKYEISALNIQLPFPPDRCLLYSGDRISGLSGIRYHDFTEEMKRTWKYYLIGQGIDPESLK